MPSGHDDTLDLTDRAAGCLLLLYGQQLSRTAAMTARMPAAVLADLLHLTPGTAVHWMREAEADWNR